MEVLIQLPRAAALGVELGCGAAISDQKNPFQYLGMNLSTVRLTSL